MMNSVPVDEHHANLSQPCNVLTVAEVAAELRCSKAHIHHLIAGKVRGVRPLPSLWLGRRRLILRASFDEWVRANEQYAGTML
jgi:excisionase family DNA binding protein